MKFMIIPVIWKSYKKETINRGYWDQAMLEDIFSRKMWTPVDGNQFMHFDDFIDLQLTTLGISKEEYIQNIIESKNQAIEIEGAIVIIPARHHADKIEEINKDIASLSWCIVILTGDEEAVFPCEQLKHPNMMIYVMTPHIGKHKNADRFLINGYAPDATLLSEYDKEGMGKPLNWFFAGQVTHQRRKDCVKALKKMENGELYESKGFTLGLSHEEYYKKMASAKIVPCPSGAVIPDSFRIWETLEAGALPIVDELAPNIETNKYWNFVLGDEELPFPIITDWKELPGTVQYHIDTYPIKANKAFAWWQKFKRKMVYDLEDDINYLNKSKPNMNDVDDQITVLIPTSPIEMHPDTSVIEETIKTIRERLPKAEIIIMFDGIRSEQEERRTNYDEYVRRMLWKCNHEYTNILPLVFNEHKHQAEMTREALKLVRTPTILFVEHDTPLCETIPFSELIQTVNSGQANMIRLHHEALILPDHKYLMLDPEPQLINNIPLTRTAQWSQRPHVASTEFYRKMLENYFTRDSKTMIEDKIHGIAYESYLARGQVGWNDFKIWIYSPSGDMKRSYHLDARGHDPKFEETFKF